MEMQDIEAETLFLTRLFSLRHQLLFNFLQKEGKDKYPYEDRIHVAVQWLWSEVRDAELDCWEVCLYASTTDAK